MGDGAVVCLIVVAVAVVIVIRLLAGSIDTDRIGSYVRKQGGTLLSKSWDPLGPGWYGEKDSRIYKIAYRDQDGNTHEAHVKTSMLSGVYLTNDRVTKHSNGPATSKSVEVESLAAENERLKRRIRELEGDDSSPG